MSKCLEGQGWKVVGDGGGEVDARKKEIVILPLEGTHDEIWELGDGLRRGIEVAIQGLYPEK